MQWLLNISLLLFSFLQLFFIRALVIKKEKIAFKSAVSSLIFIWLIFIVNNILDFNIPDIAFIFVVASSFTDSYFGYYLNLYNKTKKYDRIQHILGSFSFAILLYFLFSNFFEYGGSKEFRAFYIFLLGILSGVFFEMVEFVSDLKNNKKMQKGLIDTDFDMVSDIIGSIIASAYAFFILL